MTVAAVTALIAVIAGTVTALPAHAADAALNVTKTVNGTESIDRAPGEEFTYNITVGCDDADCVDAELLDPFPVALAGFEIVSQPTLRPASQPGTVWLEGCDSGVAAGCGLRADFATVLDGGGEGIRAGETYQISVTLKVPQSLAPTWEHNGQAIVNSAVATSSTAEDRSDTATVTVRIPTTVDLTVGKSWSPASQQFQPGVRSTVDLQVRNTSNIGAAALTLQDPTAADDGAADLDASNPFQIVDFIGFGAVSAPQGADLVVVDAYVYNAGSWNWVEGVATAPDAIALPGGVEPGEVGGIRVRFESSTGATIEPNGAAGTVQFEVAQRAENRNTGDALVLGADANNQVTGTVEVPEQEPATKTASAPYEIGGLDVRVTATKSIEPRRIPAGTSATATIGARNDSNGPLSSLTLSDEDYFTEDLTFGGFTQPLPFLSGADAAEITWIFSDGSTSIAQVTAGETPAAPAAPAGEHLTGFAVEYSGQIAPGAVVNLSFAIDAAPDLVQGSAGDSEDANNTVVVDAVNPAGSASDEESAPLTIFFPTIDIELEKSVSPVAPVTPGGTVVVQLPTRTATDSAYVNPTHMVIEDVWRDGDENDFWNAFNPTAIAPTQVLSGSTLTVDYTTDGGDTWTQLVVYPATDTTRVVSGDLATLLPGLDPSTVTGLRFSFEHPDGFAAGTTLSPNLVFEARGTLRDGSGEPTSVTDEDATTYENLASASAQGRVAGDTAVESETVEDVADASIISYSGDAGALMADKRWNPASLSSQSAERATSTLGWGVTATGFDSVTIADPNGGENTPQSTVFQAFDLKEIRPSSHSLLRWDVVSTVELYMNGSWQTVAAPGGSWMNGNSFKGYTLTAEQSADTTGVRITVAPNDAARNASADPLRPQPGSGVATSAAGNLRTFDLVWELRNKVRVADAAGEWATATHGYNVDGSPAAIRNTVGVAGVRNGQPVGPHGDSADIGLIDQPPAVLVSKSTDRDVVRIPIPVEGEVPGEGYPTLDYTIVAENNSSSRASYVRISDPMPCTDATVSECGTQADGWAENPFAGAEYDAETNPFERFDLQRVTVTLEDGSGVDKNASMVTLWKRAADGSLSTEVVSVAAVEAYSAAQLADVVGIGVVYQGTDPAQTGGTIPAGKDLGLTLSTKLRVHDRSVEGQAVQPRLVPNYVFAQSYDPVLSPDEASSLSQDNAHADVELIDGVLDVTAQKTITPASLLERDRDTPVNVQLRTTSGDSTVATHSVILEDSDQDFWNRFRLVSLDQVELPAGADRVRVDVQLDGETEWVEGAPAATASLPDVDPAAITGIRFVLDRADGAVFSNTAPPQGWQATARLTVGLLDTVRGTDEQIPFPSTIDNEISAESVRIDPDLYAPARAEAADDIRLETGSFGLAVSKDPEDGIHTVTPAETVPWTLDFRNSGSGYLTVDRVTDTLPASLELDLEQEPTYRTSDGGTLSTDVTYAYDQATRQLVFTWPDDGKRMSPGEAFTIELGIVLQPGLTQNDRATNQFVVQTAQELSSCTNPSNNGQGVLSGLAVNECGTTNFVSPVPGASLATFKGVKGEVDGELVDGAVNTVNPDGACVTDSEGYFRSPCAAYTTVGATDEWKLETVNSGTEPYTSLTLVEPLPTPGDRMLATGGSRASTFRPVFDGATGLNIQAPDGATVVWQVTTDAAACVGTGDTTWPNDPTCSANDWIDAASYTGDWADITGLRVELDFTTTAAGVLPPGGGVTVRYNTVNTPASEADPERTPVEAPVADEFAWNQYGAVATLTNGSTLQRAPVKAGVTLLGGSVQVNKAIDGAALGYASDEFRFDVSCTVAGAEVDLGSNAVVTVTRSGEYTARVTGVPLGAECTVNEQGEVGEFGETIRVGANAVVDVITPDDNGNTVNEAQTVSATNVYNFGALSITKAVDTLATVGEFGPFEFELSCTSLLGQQVVLDPADERFSLSANETHTVAAGTIPVGAECSVVETDADGAGEIAFTGDGVADAGDGSAVITVGESTSVGVTNSYAAGTLSVLKTVVGDGAEAYGDGPFAASVTCTYGDQIVYQNDALAIVPDVATDIEERFPVGTVCEVVEVVTGGANEHENPAAVVITGPEDGEELGAVTALVTNHFYTGELQLVKERIGDGVEDFGVGPFEVQVTCIWVKNGETLTVPIAAGGILSLSEENEYLASIEGIIVGAECAVVETDPGLAVATTYSPEDGVVTIVDPALEQDPATVVITNRFDIGQLEIVKTVERPTVSVGEEVVYSITVTNTGQIDAEDLTVTDVLPDGASFVSAQPTAAIDGQTLTWTLDTLNVGESTEFTVTVTYDAAGAYVNRASVTNPDGPWHPITVAHACDDDGSASCASVTVTTLASTGVNGVMTALGIALAVLALGLLLLFVAMSRRARQR